MYKALGATWFSDQTVLKFTSGTYTGTATVNLAGQTGTSINFNAGVGTLVVGDIITFGGVNAVNRVTKQSTGELRQFVVTVAVANMAVAGSISIYPSLIPSSGGSAVQYQTVDNSPGNLAAISLVLNASQQYRKNFRYSPMAVTMATGDLPLPANKVVARHKYDNVSMRAITDYMIGTDQEITRLDVLFGSLVIRPEWMCVIPDII